MSYLRYLCIVVSNTYIVFLFSFVFLCLVYPMLPVSLDYPLLIAPSIFSNVYCSNKVHRRTNHIPLSVFKLYIMFIMYFLTCLVLSLTVDFFSNTKKKYA